MTRHSDQRPRGRWISVDDRKRKRSSVRNDEGEEDQNQRNKHEKGNYPEDDIEDSRKAAVAFLASRKPGSYKIDDSLLKFSCGKHEKGGLYYSASSVVQKDKEENRKDWEVAYDAYHKITEVFLNLVQTYKPSLHLVNPEEHSVAAYIDLYEKTGDSQLKTCWHSMMPYHSDRPRLNPRSLTPPPAEPPPEKMRNFCRYGL